VELSCQPGLTHNRDDGPKAGPSTNLTVHFHHYEMHLAKLNNQTGKSQKALPR